MSRYFVPLGLALALALVIVAVPIGAQQQGSKTAGGPELVTDQFYHFVPVGEDFAEIGNLGKVKAVNGNWVKVEMLVSLQWRLVWLNLDNVGAIQGPKAVRKLDPAELQAIE